MKTNDQNISHKLDQLDTLGGGIVFGREEAWEKLQARMDKTPARRIGLYYGAAAAVLLLLVACLMFLFNRPEPQLAIARPQQMPVSAPVVPSIAREAPAPVPEARPAQKKIAKIAGQPAITPSLTVPIETPEELPVLQNVQPAPVVSLASAAPAPMRIVHINELDKEAPNVVVSTKPALAAKPMKVVTMSELMREDYPPLRTEDAHRESTTSLVKVLFRQDQFTSGGNTTSAQNPLNIRINLQN